MQSFFSKLFQSNNPNISRYYTGIIIIGILALIFIINIKFLAWLAIGFCFFVAFYEAIKLYDLENRTNLYTIATILWIITYFHNNPISAALVAIVIMASYNTFKQKKSKDYLVIIYPTIPFLCFFDIYTDFGAKTIIWLIVTVAFVDTGAYFGGRLFGKSPLSPISPKKTLEGALIGFVIATLIGCMIGMMIGKGFVSAFFITLCVAGVSIFGDLYESMLKRNANVKDSGNILPGHGGMLDRIDGLLFSSVVMLFLLDWI